MAQAQTSSAASKSAQDIQIIKPPGDLKKKALRPGNPSTAALDAIASAEKAMGDLSVNFDEWMVDESLRLRHARDNAKSSQFSAEAIDELFHASHDIKGQAATLGYPLAAEICGSLCQLLESIEDTSKIPPLLVDQHVDTVRAIVREGSAEKDNPTAIVVLKRLREVTHAYLAAQRAKPAAANGKSPAKT